MKLSDSPSFNACTDLLLKMFAMSEDNPDRTDRGIVAGHDGEGHILIMFHGDEQDAFLIKDLLDNIPRAKK